MPKILGILKDNPKSLTKTRDHFGGGVGGVPPRLLDIVALNSQNITKKDIKSTITINQFRTISNE